MKKTEEESQLKHVRTLNSHLDFSIAQPEQECSQKHAEPHLISKKNVNIFTRNSIASI